MIILAIGGAVIKTSWSEIKELAQKRMFDVLIHNGGSMFHDFQRATEKLESHSYSLEDLLIDFECNRPASELVWKWVEKGEAPNGSLTHICQDRDIPVLMFTVLGTDFWQLFDIKHSWSDIALRSWFDFRKLKECMNKPFHFICMGSAVVHPEVFTKALAVVKPKKFRADVVDFLDMYRERTRVAKYGYYWRCTHKQYLNMWIKKGSVPLPED